VEAEQKTCTRKNYDGSLLLYLEVNYHTNY